MYAVIYWYCIMVLSLNVRTITNWEQIHWREQFSYVEDHLGTCSNYIAHANMSVSFKHSTQIINFRYTNKQHEPQYLFSWVLTSNWTANPVMFLGCTICSNLPMAILMSAAAISVSPHVISSSRALWMKMYWVYSFEDTKCWLRSISTVMIHMLKQLKASYPPTLLMVAIGNSFSKTICSEDLCQTRTCQALQEYHTHQIWQETEDAGRRFPNWCYYGATTEL
jgi:hypothetical protein